MLMVVEDDTTISLAGPRAAHGYMPHPQWPKLAEQHGKLLWVAGLRQVVHTHKALQEPEAPRVHFIMRGGFSLLFLFMPQALVT